MAVNSKADKKHGHTVRSLQSVAGITGGATLSKPSYSATKPAVGISQSGQKALAFRARKELANVSDPTKPLTE